MQIWIGFCSAWTFCFFTRFTTSISKWLVRFHHFTSQKSFERWFFTRFTTSISKWWARFHHFTSQKLFERRTTKSVLSTVIIKEFVSRRMLRVRISYNKQPKLQLHFLLVITTHLKASFEIVSVNEDTNEEWFSSSLRINFSPLSCCDTKSNQSDDLSIGPMTNVTRYIHELAVQDSDAFLSIFFLCTRVESKGNNKTTMSSLHPM